MNKRDYCFCPADDGLLYVEFRTASDLLNLLLQTQFRNVAHFRTRHGYVPYSGGGIAFNAQAMYLKGVRPLWFLKKNGNIEEAIDQLLADGIYKNEREIDKYYESQYVKECEWKGPSKLRFDLDDVEFIWIGPRESKRDIVEEIEAIFPDLEIVDQAPEKADNPCWEAF